MTEAGDCYDSAAAGESRVITRQVSGKYYLSPLRTAIEGDMTALRSLQPGDVTTLRRLRRTGHTGQGRVTLEAKKGQAYCLTCREPAPSPRLRTPYACDRLAPVTRKPN
jgi:hypothetical protein